MRFTPLESDSKFLDTASKTLLLLYHSEHEDSTELWKNSLGSVQCVQPNMIVGENRDT